MNVECRRCNADTIEDQYKGDRVVRCADCGRIIYRDFADRRVVDR